MDHWWHREILDPGTLPLLLCFLSFVLTFVTTRGVTRLIRHGRGPFKDNVTRSGLHIHHSIYGIVALVVGAFVAVSEPDGLAARVVAAVLIGAGTSLILDEFALLLDLKDVYWTGAGQLSVQAVTLTAGVLGLLLAGFNPFDVSDVGVYERALRVSASALIATDWMLSVCCALKGKYRCALYGLFLLPVAFVGAVRLGRPNSVWARHRYRGPRLEHATRRAAAFDRRWQPVQDDWSNFIGGRVNPPNTTT